MDATVPTTLRFYVKVNKKTGYVTIGNVTKQDTGNSDGVMFDVLKDDIFAAADNAIRINKTLHALAVHKQFDFAQLLVYLSNTHQIRLKHLAEILDVPPYVAKQIILVCMRFQGLIQTGYYYVKSALFAEALMKFEVPKSMEKEKFVPVKERIGQAKTASEETWEGWNEIEDDEDGNNDGLKSMINERERIVNAINLKTSIRKLLLAQADKWIKLKQSKRQKARGSDLEALKRERQLEEEERQREEEDPALVRKHFRKKKK